MARIRSVHPGLFTDETFVSVSPLARLLAIGLWTEADDNGIFLWKPITIKMRLLPADSTDVPALLAELSEANLVRRFEHDGKSYGAIRNFCRWQRPKKPNPIHFIPDEFRTYVGSTSVSGEPERRKEGGDTELGATSNNNDTPPVPHQFPTSSPPVPHQFRTGGEKYPQMEEGGDNMEEERGEESPPTAPPEGGATTGAQDARRGTRLPDDWQPSADDCAFAAAIGISDIGAVADEFADYWRAVPGAKGRKLDWAATFRNRCREVSGRYRRGSNGNRGQDEPGPLLRSAARIADRMAARAGGDRG